MRRDGYEDTGTHVEHAFPTLLNTDQPRDHLFTQIYFGLASFAQLVVVAVASSTKTSIHYAI